LSYARKFSEHIANHKPLQGRRQGDYGLSARLRKKIQQKQRLFLRRRAL